MLDEESSWSPSRSATGFFFSLLFFPCPPFPFSRPKLAAGHTEQYPPHLFTAEPQLFCTFDCFVTLRQEESVVQNNSFLKMPDSPDVFGNLHTKVWRYVRIVRVSERWWGSNLYCLLSIRKFTDMITARGRTRRGGGGWKRWEEGKEWDGRRGRGGGGSDGRRGWK